MDYLTAWHGAGAYLVGLLVTLVLAAHLTPRRWWKRPNARALLILAGGSWGLGALLLTMLPAAAVPAPPPAAVTASAFLPPQSAPLAAVAGQPFITHRDLNLRGDASVAAPRLLLVPAGSSVMPTGARRGDWWQIRVRVDGHDWQGWASSLWLRRSGEAAPAP